MSEVNNDFLEYGASFLENLQSLKEFFSGFSFSRTTSPCCKDSAFVQRCPSTQNGCSLAILII